MLDAVNLQDPPELVLGALSPADYETLITALRRPLIRAPGLIPEEVFPDEAMAQALERFTAASQEVLAVSKRHKYRAIKLIALLTAAASRAHDRTEPVTACLRSSSDIDVSRTALLTYPETMQDLWALLEEHASAQEAGGQAVDCELRNVRYVNGALDK